MVYKIQGNFNEDNFEGIFKKLGPHFKLIYKYNTLFAALIDYNFVNKSESYLRNALRPSKDFYISEINEKNIMREEQSIIQWCRDNLVNLDRQRYEKEEQARLKKVKILNQILSFYRLNLKEWQGSKYILSNLRGGSIIVNDLGDLWAKVYELEKISPDALDIKLLHFLHHG